MRDIKEIIIHCTATSEDATLAAIKNYHVNVCGWSDIGYHFLIDKYGRVLHGRPIEQVGAHCKGHNAHSIGVAYIGGKDGKDTRTMLQKNALRELVFWFRTIFPNVSVRGHNEFSNKLCPCFDVQKEYGIKEE